MYKFVGSKGYVISCPLGIFNTKDATQKQLKYLLNRNIPFKNSVIFVEKEKDAKISKNSKKK